MKVWKSPVFYFGIVLVLAVLSAMLAPFRGGFGEATGQSLRPMAKSSRAARWKSPGPSVSGYFRGRGSAAQDVRIANPPGSPDAWFATADQIVVRMNLGSLFNAEIQVESINVDSPTIKLRRSLDGSANWNFEPAENIRSSRLLDQVKLDQITLSDGTVQVVDDRRSAYAELEEDQRHVLGP